MEFFLISMLNGLSYGLLLFMLSSGLTLIFSMMGVLNFAHASFYMLGAYFGYTLSGVFGFWPALVLAPVLTGAAGAVFESQVLRKVHKMGHVSELLVTFGLSYIVLELVQLIWGRVAVEFNPPVFLQGPMFTLINHSQQGLSLVSGEAGALCQAAEGVRVVCSPFPATRGFVMLTAMLMVISLWWVLTKTRAGLIIQAALTHPQTVETLGHNVPRIFMLVFAMGTGLAGLAGVIGGFTFITEPAMAATVGSVVFVVVVVGGMGSLSGAFLASLLIGIVQTFAVAVDYSLMQLLTDAGLVLSAHWQDNTILKLSVSQVAPILPYLLLVLILIFRPRGLLGKRET
ncbi:MAG: High-affinity branched-chain amino acid transport system permease protein LivH [Pseudomonadota bacterium]|jgi:branched-chain amino acid transport system permease protein